MRRSTLEQIHRKAARAVGVLSLALTSGRPNRDAMLQAQRDLLEASRMFNTALKTHLADEGKER